MDSILSSRFELLEWSNLFIPFQELIAAAAPHRIGWHWVKGHSGHPENDRVDALACAEADKQRS